MKAKTIGAFLALIVIWIIYNRVGAVSITFNEMYTAFLHKLLEPSQLSMTEQIFTDIRLPRSLLTLGVGASLAVGGVLLQGLFLNPIVEPGLIGTSGGAAFGAALYFTLGASLDFGGGDWALPFMAFIGGMAATWLVYLLAENKSKSTSVIYLLLVGVAVNALFLSGIGFLSYIARDPQARSITFWNLGTTSGATWFSVVIVLSVLLVCMAIAIHYSKQLNALMLGNEEAHYLGVDIKRLKFIILFINVVLVSVATAFTGVIAFVGLIVPHLVRVFLGSDTRLLLWGSAVLGAILLLVADILARTLLTPAELPIGIVTTIVGAPLFISLLKKSNYV